MNRTSDYQNTHSFDMTVDLFAKNQVYIRVTHELMSNKYQQFSFHGKQTQFTDNFHNDALRQVNVQ